MAVVTATVECAFGAAPFADPAGWTWTDISAYVRSLDPRLGKSHELDDTPAGELELRLTNVDKRFEPERAASPYYPNIKPMTPIRVKLSDGVGTYGAFFGFVEDWGEGYGDRPVKNIGESHIDVRAVDGFKLLNMADLSTYRTEVLSDEPLAYFPMGEPYPGDNAEVGLNHITNLGSDDTIVMVDHFSAAFDLGKAGPLPGGALASGDVGGYWESGVLGDVWKPIKAAWTVEAFLYADNDGATTPEIVRIDGLPGEMFSFGQDATGHPFVENQNNTAVSTTVLADATWHHVAAAWDGHVCHFYVDGVAAGTATLRNVGAIGASAKLRIGAYVGGGLTARIAHIAVYDRELPADRIAAHAAKNVDLVVAQTVSSAIDEILDAVGWPAAGRTYVTAAGQESCAAFLPDGKALATILMLAEHVDGGIVMMNPADGDVWFRSKNTILADQVSGATLGDGGGAELAYADVGFTYDEADLHNVIRVSANDLPDVVATDAASVAAYGARELPFDGGAMTDANVMYSRAFGLLNRYKDPHRRPEHVTMQHHQDAAILAAMVNPSVAGIAERLTVTRRPPGAGSFSSVAIVEGVSQHLEPEDSRALTSTIALAPAEGPFWILNDATYGVLNTTTIIGY